MRHPETIPAAARFAYLTSRSRLTEQSRSSEYGPRGGHGAEWAEPIESGPHGSNATVGSEAPDSQRNGRRYRRFEFGPRGGALSPRQTEEASEEKKGNPNPSQDIAAIPPPRCSSSSSLLRLSDPMEGGEARCPGDPMDFSWSADWEKRACPSPDGEVAAAAPAQPAPSPQEAVESMILVSGPRVVMSGLRLGDCCAGGVLVAAAASLFLGSWLLLVDL